MRYIATVYGSYIVTADGWVFKKNYKKTGKTKLLKQSMNNDGYKTIVVWVDNQRMITGVHRLVALAFLPNEQRKPQVNHKNGIRSDNRLANLEWCTNSENALHGYRVNHRVITAKERRLRIQRFHHENNPNAKLTRVKVRIIRELREKHNYKYSELVELFSVSKSVISKVCNYKSWVDTP